MEVMKDGALISNTGHYDCEINIEELRDMASSVRTIRSENEEYTMPTALDSPACRRTLS